MQVERDTIAVTTNASGAVTGYSTKPFTGRILGISLNVPGVNGIASASIAITVESTGEPVLTVSGISSSTNWYPRAPTNDLSGAALLYAAGGTHQSEAIAMSNDSLIIAITGGGNTKNATFSVMTG